MKKELTMMLIGLIALAGCVSGPGGIFSTLSNSQDAHEAIPCALEGEQLAVKGHTYSMLEFTSLAVANVAGAACLLQGCLDGYEPDYPENASYLESSKAPHDVNGSFESLEFNLSETRIEGIASEIIISSDGNESWIKVTRKNGEVMNVYSTSPISFKGELDFQSTQGSSFELSSNKTAHISKPLVTSSAINVTGSFDTQEGTELRRKATSISGATRAEVMSGKMEKRNFDKNLVTKELVEFTGSLDYEGKENLTGRIGLKGAVAVNPNEAKVTGLANQIYLDGVPKLKAELKASPETLCFKTKKGGQFALPVSVKESSGNADALDVKAYLLYDGNNLSITTGSVFGDLYQVFVAGLERYGDVKPLESKQLYLYVKAPETEQKGVLYVRCDNCKAQAIPIIIKPE